jgi:hypothetical protein
MSRWLLKLIGRYSFVITLIALSFLCFALAEAKADTLGLPYNQTFEKASFPYARVLSGCTEWRQPAQLANSGDQWGPVSFAGACQAHDQCFHNPAGLIAMPKGQPASWGECNRQYLADLRLACERDLQKARLENGALGEPDSSALQLCYEIANLYFERAQAPAAVKRFEFAQKMAGEYLTFVRGVLGDLYKELKGRPGTKAEVEKALAALFDGQDIDTIKISINGGKAPAHLSTSAPLPRLEESETTNAVIPAAAEVSRVDKNINN